jgi:hypothetical protein
MKTNALQKLLTSARKACQPPPPADPAEPPLGFATRVAALWRARQGGPRRADLWERCSWWGAGASIAICLILIVHHAVQPEPDALDAAFFSSAQNTENN